MNLKILATAVVLLTAGFVTSSRAQNTSKNSPAKPASDSQCLYSEPGRNLAYTL